jgi:hypothetical protein
MRLNGTLALAAVAAFLAGCGDDEGTDAEREYSDTTAPTTAPRPPAPAGPRPPRDTPDQAAVRSAVDAYLKAIAAKDARKVCDSLEKPSKDCEQETRRALDELPRQELDAFRRARIVSIQASERSGTARTSYLTALISIPVKKVGREWKIAQSETAPPSTPPPTVSPPGGSQPGLPTGPETGPGTTPQPPGGLPSIPEPSPSD